MVVLGFVCLAVAVYLLFFDLFENANMAGVMDKSIAFCINAMFVVYIAWTLARRII